MNSLTSNNEIKHRFRNTLEISKISAILGLIFASTSLFAAPPDKVCTIDFEGLQSGETITSLSVGNGISGCNLKGTVEVTSFNSIFSSEAAIVFDSTCPLDPFVYCDEEDDDLGAPNETFGGPGVGTGGEMGQPHENGEILGMVAVLAKDKVDSNPADGLVDDPDDADVPGEYTFDFSGIDSRGVTVSSVTIMDVEFDENEDPAEVILKRNGGPPAVFTLIDTGDNGVAVIDTIGIPNVHEMVVKVRGSSALAAVTFGESQRSCWATFGGFDSAFTGPEGQKIGSFGGNVGPPPSGHLNIVRHTDGAHLSVPTVTVDNCVRDEQICSNSGSNSPGQPGGKKGFDINVLNFVGTGKLTDAQGDSTMVNVTGSLVDCGEPAGKKGNDPDQFHVFVDGTLFVGDVLGGGNVQLHPPVGKN
jgi:hypothetical protein